MLERHKRNTGMRTLRALTFDLESLLQHLYAKSQSWNKENAASMGRLLFFHTHTQLKIPQKRLSIAAVAASGQSGSMNGGGGTTFFCAVNTSKGGTSSIGVDQ